MRFKERPDGRVLERGSKQGRYEKGQKIEDDGRTKIKLPKPKKTPDIGRMCIYCGRVFPSTEDGELTCPACSNPSVGP